MALDAAGLVVVPRVHRSLDELVLFVAPMPLFEVTRKREEAGTQPGALLPSMLHPRAGRRVTGAAEFGGTVLAAMTDGTSVLEERMCRGRADVQIELRMRAPRVEDVIRRILNPLEL